MTSSSIKLSAQESPIKAVTVYKSRNAEVVRIFQVALQSGSNKIEITELPSCIDTHSVRVSGLGDARLFDVVCTTRDKSKKPSEAVRALKAKKAALHSERRVRDHESDLLVSYAKTMTAEHVPPKEISSILQSFVDHGRKNIDAVAELDEKLAALDLEIEAEQQKETFKKGLTTGEVTVVVGTDSAIHVDLKLTYIVTNASWESTYELHAETETNKPSSSVSLHYRARILQSTGEDWNDTSLTLNTVAASTFAKSIPWLNPVKIRPQTHGWKPQQAGRNGFSQFTNNNVTLNSNNHQTQSIFGPPSFAKPATGGLFGGPSAFGSNSNTLFGGNPLAQQQPQQAAGLFGTGTFGTSVPQPQQQVPLFPPQPPAGLFGGSGTSQPLPAPTPPTFVPAAAPSEPDGLDDFEEIAIPEAQAGTTTIVNETPLAISYSVKGMTTVPSDGTAHQVSIAILPFDAKISHICTPRLDPRVYLQCHVKNTSEYRLLPGPVSVVLNDGFVSKTSITEINTGDTFSCTLGDDVATKVTYARSSKTVTAQGGAFQETLNSTTYNTKITIHNKHPFTLADLVVRDVIPTCDDKRGKVLLRKPDGLAEAKADEVVKLKTPPGVGVCWGKTADGRPGEKDGRFEWALNVEAGAKAVLEAEWELKAPADVAWVESVSNV
ncbi:hypothetical protein FB45DRAFT_889070 [Roridomyces roridus]|uniref:DUF4139 domain-containing protein n=1 Tax=Roridomyces roridus TaxID=1738132 RepID=A0AAD7CK90_9AGAR|nr:hypothetical protein FB45DRAFT_889070 [Roridomyces roridus]